MKTSLSSVSESASLRALRFVGVLLGALLLSNHIEATEPDDESEKAIKQSDAKEAPVALFSFQPRPGSSVEPGRLSLPPLSMTKRPKGHWSVR